MLNGNIRRKAIGKFSENQREANPGDQIPDEHPRRKGESGNDDPFRQQHFTDLLPGRSQRLQFPDLADIGNDRNIIDAVNHQTGKKNDQKRDKSNDGGHFRTGIGHHIKIIVIISDIVFITADIRGDLTDHIPYFIVVQILFTVNAQIGIIASLILGEVFPDQRFGNFSAVSDMSVAGIEI